MTTRRLHLLILILLTLALFGPSLSHQFVWDDHMFIKRWPALHSWSNLPQLLKGDLPPENGRLVYRPLRSLLYLVNYQLFGTNPLPYRVQAIAIQVALVILVYLTLGQLIVLDRPHHQRNTNTSNQSFSHSAIQPFSQLLSPSFLGAAVFAVHPVNLEATLFTTSSMDVPGLIFFLLAFHSYLKSKSSLVTGFWYLVAILFNEMALTLPIIIWLHHRLFKPKIKFNYKPMIIVLVTYLISRAILLDPPSVNPIYMGALNRLKIASFLLIKYITHLFVPHPITVNHPLIPGLTTQSPYDLLGLTPPSLPWWPLLTVIGLSLFAYKKRARLYKHPLVTFTLLWIPVTLLPILQFVPTATLFTDHYATLPSVGLSLIFTIAIKHLSPRTVFIVSGLLLLVALHSQRLVPIWQSDFTLWSHAYRYTPNSPAVLVNLANAQYNQGNVIRAESLYLQAIDVNPNLPTPYLNLTKLYIGQNNLTQASGYLIQGLKHNPNNADLLQIQTEILQSNL